MILPASLRRLLSIVTLTTTAAIIGCGGSDSGTDAVPTPGKHKPGSGGSGTGGNNGSGGGNGDAGNLAAGTVIATNSAEICNNGLDDDQNGFVDDQCACDDQTSEPCFLGDPALAGKGACTFGSQSCASFTSGEFTQSGWTTCIGSGSASTEVCGDGIDNDCDGTVDNGCPCTTGETYPCNTACGPGSSKCVNGKIGACSAPAPSQEICDGKDNNCDGKVDENLSQNCSTACGAGTEKCVNGKFGACSAPQPSAEICDGKDNNCDGQVDEGCSCKNGASQSCTNNCGSGTQTCSGGKWGACSAPLPTKEICDGKDNDCNGLIDDGLPTTSCSTPCGAGVAQCVNGMPSACVTKNPPAEVCGNKKDDNCDGQVDENCSKCSLLCDGACCQGTAKNCCADGKCPGADGSCPTAGGCTTVFCNAKCCATGTACCGDGSCPGADGSCPKPACTTVTCAGHCCGAGTACCSDGKCPAADGSCGGTEPSCTTAVCNGDCCPNGDACCPGGACPPASGKCETPCETFKCKNECCLGLGKCCADGACPDAFGECAETQCATVQCDWECCANGTTCCDNQTCPAADGSCPMGGTMTTPGCQNSICGDQCCGVPGDCCGDGTCPTVDGSCTDDCQFVTCDGECCFGGNKCCDDGTCPFADGSCLDDGDDSGTGGKSANGGASSGDDTAGSSGDDVAGSSGDDTAGSSGDDTAGSSGDDGGGMTGSGGGTAVVGKCNGGFVKTMLVLDRSMSMALTPNGKRLAPSSSDFSTARWAIAAKAVQHMFDGTPPENSVQWGLTFFPRYVAPQANRRVGCERLPDAVKNGLWVTNDPEVCDSGDMEVSPGPNSLDQIKPLISETQTFLCDTTATLEALSIQEGNGLAYVVLVTDGQYECDMDPLPAVQALFPTTKTFVVGFDSADANLLGTKGQKSLNDMACAGGVPQNKGACSAPDPDTGAMTYTGSGTAFYYASDSAGSQLDSLLQDVAKALTCPFGCHDLCDVDSNQPVARSCDNQNNCAKKVCDDGGTYQDDQGMSQSESPHPYCCDDTWDAPCREYAEELCDLECNGMTTKGSGGAGGN